MGEAAIVTGAGSGIGLATVRHLLLADPDLTVIGADLNTGWAAPLVAEHGRDRVREIRLDVTDHDEVRAVFDRLAEEIGPPVKLVNSAGVQFNAAALDLDFRDWSRVLAINLSGTFSCCQAAGRHMAASGRGAIVNICSSTMYFGFSRRLPYVVSKNGVKGLTQTLAAEWGDVGVRVNAVSPGYVGTPLINKAVDRGEIEYEQVAAYASLNRMAEPKELAAAIAFLLSDEASYITGTVLDVDGGFRIRKT